MKKKKERVLWVDVFKGIMITLMVLGHSKSPLLNYIYAFHMAAFFFISGYTTDYNKYSLYEYIKKKFKTLVVPFFFVNTMFYVGLLVFQKTSLYSLFIPNPISLQNVKELYLYFWTAPLGGATWFLMALFLSNVACKIMDEIVGEIYNKEKEYVKVFISFILTILSYLLLYSKKISLPFYLDLLPMAMLFISIGKLVATNYKDLKKEYKITISITTILVYFWYVIMDYSHIEWVSKSFPELGIMLLVSIGGISLVYYISLLIIKMNIKRFTNLWIYLGQNTIGIVLYHFFVFKILYVIYYFLKLAPLEQLGQNCLWKTTTILSTITAALAIALSIIMHKLVSKVVDLVKNIDYKKLMSNKWLVGIGLLIITFVYNRWTFQSGFVFDDWNNLVTLSHKTF